MKKRNAAIKAINTCLPVSKLTNEQLAEEYGDWSSDKIFDKTGIVVRSVASPDECASDLVSPPPVVSSRVGLVHPKTSTFYSFVRKALIISSRLLLARCKTVLAFVWIAAQ